MPKLKVLSGKDLIRIFGGFGFSMASQKGSHVKLVRVINSNRQTLTIPNHDELDRGTLKAICNQALKYIDREEVIKNFYSS
ncbi:MAG: type II toxin-antitoxin system HicA family toxin [bacterium]|nr:type II toxin-antitoxin system HicA family toxin [bacterium]